ncbi:hypothetical protein GWI33_002293 [Rhynchophorus ferrugineus]|uniref:Uncharacterized protein n=1 Tax=Rhynchophorus ferrugineus TaxID=354439 RepID=A0A834HL99_RHYFE|nr:hypothetical protein GWI33_002293 [Rhynchophorus ferrugineus]
MVFSRCFCRRNIFTFGNVNKHQLPWDVEPVLIEDFFVCWREELYQMLLRPTVCKCTTGISSHPSCLRWICVLRLSEKKRVVNTLVVLLTPKAYEFNDKRRRKWDNINLSMVSLVAMCVVNGSA